MLLYVISGDSPIKRLCSLALWADEDEDSLVLLSTSFVAGRARVALHTLFHFVLRAVLQGGETEALGGEPVPAQQGCEPALPHSEAVPLSLAPVLGRRHSVAAPSRGCPEEAGGWGSAVRCWFLPLEEESCADSPGPSRESSQSRLVSRPGTPSTVALPLPGSLIS